MVEMGTALSFYEDQRDRLARRLPAPSLGSAAAAAAGQRNRILNRFERAKRELRAEHEALSDGEPESGPLSPMAEIAGQDYSAGKAWPWASLRFTRRAAAVAAVFAAVGVGTILAETRDGQSLDVVSAPSRAVAGVPEALAAVGERPREPRAARGRDDESAPKPGQGNASQDQATLAAAEIPPPAPEPVPEPSPAPIVAAAPVVAPTPAPAPPPANESKPDPKPRPDPKPGPGPVSSLPPPVGSLPPPGKGGG